MISKIVITKKMKIPSEITWEAIRKIGRLDVWFPAIETCKVEGNGIGAVRYMSLVGGGKIKDTIELIDDKNKKFVYLRPESPFPITYYKGTVEVFNSYDGLAVIAWTAEFESTPENSTPVAEIVHGAISAGLDGMEQDLLS